MILAYKNKYNYLTDKGLYWDMIKNGNERFLRTVLEKEK